ncbi:helix-turn-helix domain-containing protein [Rhodococcus hoagii]|nr:helix-turn-helix domain-containing protein [Prescottella equi]
MSRRALHGFDPARLKELRGEKGLSRSDLGRLSGVPYNTIRRWENRKLGPGSDLLARVAEVLGVDVDALAVIQDAAVSLASWRAPRRAFTQEEVAAALDMSPSTYSRLERGERPVTNGDTATLASLFGIEPEQVRSSWMRAHQRPGGTRR